jgi:D-sedoheptulose 7-phosphate isomerase
MKNAIAQQIRKEVGTMQAHSKKFFAAAERIAREVDHDAIDRLALSLADLREREGRLFILGVGGSAGNAGHAVNDFRKLCDIEAYAPTDNVSELTARTNDEGFETVFVEYIKTSRARAGDGLLIFSVGGGNLERNVSVNLIRAIEEAQSRSMSVFGIVGRDGGFTKSVGDEVVVIPNIEPDWTTPLSEGFQAVVWHALVSHPSLQINATKW